MFPSEPIELYKELFLVRTAFDRADKMTYPELVAHLEKISANLQLVLKYAKTERGNPPIDETKLELRNFEYYAMSCGVLRFLLAGLTLERHYTEDLPSSFKMNPYLLEEAFMRIKQVIQIREKALFDAGEYISDNCDWNDFALVEKFSRSLTAR